MRRREYATHAKVLRAYADASRSMKKEGGGLVKATKSAGFIGPVLGSAEYQVFVTVVRYNPQLKKEKPETGGLLCPV